LLDGLPDFVVHFWSPQSLSDFCGAFMSVSVSAASGFVLLGHELRFSG
jgi:hypothetical protein